MQKIALKLKTLTVLSATLILIATVLFISSSRKAAACAATDTSRGLVSSNFSVPAAGQYRVWSRIMVPDSTNNSFTLNLDSVLCGIVVGDSASITPNTWTWVDYSAGNTGSKINATLTLGTHTVTMIGRENAVKVDRVILTSDLACVPTGTGDNCASPPAPPAPVSVPYRIDSGGPGYTDAQGQVWNADKYFTMDNSYGSTGGVGTGGWVPGDGSTCQTTTINSNCTAHAIANTANQKGYMNERWGDFHYDIPVANGSYVVRLKFAEINPSHGARVFDVTMNGNTILSNFSIGGDVASYTADDKSFPVTVTNNNIDLLFKTLSTTTNTAEVTGIEILPAPLPPTISDVTPASGSNAGGTRVTIKGTNFANGATVKVGTLAATNVVVVNNTTITATTPAHNAGAVDVTVQNPNGQAVTKKDAFAYLSDLSVIDLQTSLANVNGLVGSYFNNASLSGKPIFSRLDTNVDFNWSSGSPAPNIPSDNFSVRWVGTITPTATGAYTICTVTDDGARLWINGVQLINSWVNQAATSHCGTLNLTAGGHYPLKYEMYEAYGFASAQLKWSGPNINGVVPVSTTYLHLY